MKNGVKNIQTLGYNGMCTVGIFFRLVQFRISHISLKSHKSFFGKILTFKSYQRYKKLFQPLILFVIKQLYFQIDVKEIVTIHFFQSSMYLLKVSKFQNEFMKSSFLQKYEPKIVRISALYYATLHPYNIWFIFILKFTDL